MNIDLLAETAVEIHEIERRMGCEIEIRQAHVSVSAFALDSEAAEIAPCHPESAHLVPDRETAIGSYRASDAVVERPVLHGVCYVARLRFRDTGVATASGWPAPTAEGCARFLIHEFRHDRRFGERAD